MKKLYTLLFALLLTFGILAGCGTADEKDTNQETNTGKIAQKENSSFPVTMKDATGEEVTIKSEPKKIVSLVPSNTEITFALGQGKKVVGVSDNDNYPEEVTKLEKVGGMELNIEKIISLQPDLVLAHEMGMSTFSEGLKQMKEAGIPVLVIKSEANFADVYDSIEMIGTAVGAKKEAVTMVEGMKSELKEIKEKAAEINDKKKVYVELDVVPNIFAAGKNTFMDEMLTIINAENVVTGDGWQSIDQEATIASNPDVIITTYGAYTENAVQNLLNRAGWQNVNAVKNKQVIDVHPDKVSRPGPRLVEGVEEFAKAVYPEVFTK